jgi:CRP/FNR family transcriptional regulator
MKRVNNIEDTMIYQAMEAEDQKFIKWKLQQQCVAKGSLLIGNESQCEGIPIVINGSMRLFRVSESGREMTIHRIAEGELCVLAALCAMGGLTYDYSIEAEVDSELAVIPPDVFIDLIDRSHAFKTYVFQTLAEKLVTALNTLESINFTSIASRLETYLETNADKNGTIKTTHEKIAIELGSTREVISRQLAKMAADGLIELFRGKIKIKK